LGSRGPIGSCSSCSACSGWFAIENELRYGLFIHCGNARVEFFVDLRPEPHSPLNPCSSALNEGMRLACIHYRTMPKDAIDFNDGFVIVQIGSDFPKQGVRDNPLNLKAPSGIQRFLDGVRVEIPTRRGMGNQLCKVLQVPTVLHLYCDVGNPGVTGGVAYPTKVTCGDLGVNHGTDKLPLNRRQGLDRSQLHAGSGEALLWNVEAIVRHYSSSAVVPRERTRPFILGGHD